MNWLAVLLALLIAALPVSAGACPMDAAATSTQAPLTADAEQGHDCCPDDRQAAPESPCDGDTHCGQCAVPGSALPTQPAPVGLERPGFRFAALSEAVLSSHHLPPYRPPIS
jgi:hypothetical protein